MSKASEWVEAKGTQMTYWQNEDAVAWVTTPHGLLKLTETCFHPEDAIKFAHWILDTFGEPEKTDTGGVG